MEFLTLRLTREEALELHAALVQRAMLEDDIRREKGLEAVANRPLLEKFDALLRLDEKEEHRLAHDIDEDLWEHAWYAFTDEWAWFRAKKAVEEEVGAKAAATMPANELQKLVELRYQKDFDRFVKEIDMGETTQRKTA